ncbi:MAG: carboxypeptidase-like regulatory domain-containing protein [Bacteroidales bacterium]
MFKILNYNHIRKLIAVIILLICFVFSYAQETVLNKRISYKSKNQQLYYILNDIGSQIGYEFSYNADLVPSSKKIKIDVDSLEITKLLDILLADSCLTYNVIDRQIVIHKKNTIGRLLSVSSNKFTEPILSISGRIIDKDTRNPLPFANLSILGKSIGTITNEEGYFSFKIPLSFKNENLVCTYIGYKNAEIPLLDLTLQNNIVYMQQDFLSIQEVIIRSSNPEDLLRAAMNKTKDNYYTEPYLMTTFYREFVKKNDNYTSISEAVLSVYKSPYEGYYSDQVKMLKSRKNLSYSESDTFLLKLKGGLNASLFLDIIKNPSTFLIESYFYQYTYTLIDIVKFENSTAYVIEFVPKYYIEDQSFSGRLYIDTENLAIKAANFFIDSKAIDKLSQELVLKKSMKTIVKPVSAQYWVNYRQVNGLYFLNLVRGELEFKVRKRNHLFSSNFKTIFEFAVNDIDTVNIDRFDRHETLATNQIFIDNNYEYDYAFWGDYNYIIPDEPLHDALVRIAKQMQKLQENE